MHGWGGDWHMWGMWWFWLLVVAVIGVVIWLLARNAGRRNPGDSGGESPEQTLKQRYARGEIDEQEYQHKLRQLER
jgi:putative membrane protein